MGPGRINPDYNISHNLYTYVEIVLELTLTASKALNDNVVTRHMPLQFTPADLFLRIVYYDVLDYDVGRYNLMYKLNCKI